ncbi:MAG TPA: hypothetical protein VFJ71_04850 [Candidatus Limnocylindrales bacterium]|nr:hypothetical protein [Candidatus Limnocylindrales bacterium]
MIERTDRWRRAITIAGLTAVSTALWPTAGLASTGSPSPASAAPSPAAGFEPWWLVPIGLAIGVLATTLLAIVRPSTRRPIGALAVFIAFGLAGAFFVLVGLFSDFSGNHRIAWPPIAVGGVLIVAGTIAAARVSGVLRAR